MQTTEKAIGTFHPIPLKPISKLDHRQAFSVATMTPTAFGFKGFAVEGYEYIADSKYWRFEPAVEAPAVWDGEGRPPVGTVCEAQIPSKQYAWERCEIVWHHPDNDGSAAVVHGDGRLLSWSGTFRAIRTPEQIAAEERIAAAYAMCAIAPTLSNVDAMALHSAGYRKKVAP